MYKEILTKLGMTGNEAKVYLELLKMGPSASGRIIKKTEFQSSVVYHLLNKLIEKGFVNFTTETKKKIFSASDPASLNNLIDARQEELNKSKEQFNNILEELEEIKNKNEEEPKITIYRGVGGLQTIFNDIIKNASEYWNYSTRDTFSKAMPKYREYFREMRIAKKIKQRAIITDDKRKPNRQYQQKRYVPKEFASPISLQGYNDKTIIFVWDAEPPIAIVLEGKKLSKAFTNMFEAMWKTAKR